MEPHRNSGIRPTVRRIACERCRDRKTRCTHESPACQTCVKANVHCVYPIKRPRAGPASDHSSSSHGPAEEMHFWRSEQPQTARLDSVPVFGAHHSTSPDHRISMSAQTEQSQKRKYTHSPEDETSLSLGAASSPFGLNVEAAQHAPPSNHQLLYRLPLARHLPLPSLDPANRSGEEAFVCANIIKERSRLPSQPKLVELIQQYIAYCNSAFAYLHEPTLWRQMESVLNDDHVTRFDLFIVYMTLAIAISSLTRSHHPESQSRASGRVFWRYASEHAAVATNLPGLRGLQAMHLVLHFFMQNPDLGDVWKMAGMTLRAAIDLGCHHERTSLGKAADPLMQDLSRRLFWAAYGIDVNLATVLGRPPGISEDWIRAELPSLAPDENISSLGIDSSNVDPQKRQLHQFIRLRQIQAEIHQRLYSESAANQSPDGLWFGEMQSKIDMWMICLTEDHSPKSFFSSNWMELQAHLTLCLLHRPSPGNQRPNDVSLRKALQASSSLMRTFKVNFRAAWLAIHHLFMSGLTFLSCLMMSGPNESLPPLIEAMLDIQACSGILEALTTIQPGTAGIRDAFEKVSAAVIRKFSNPQIPISRRDPDEDVEDGLLTTWPPVPVLDDAGADDEPRADFLTDEISWEALQAILLDPSSVIGATPVPGLFSGDFSFTEGNFAN